MDRLQEADCISVNSTRRASSQRIDICIVPGDWGKAKASDIQFILDNVACHFLRYFAADVRAEVHVHCRPDAANASVSRLTPWSRKHDVVLATHNCNLWCFQFAHELCHIVCGYSNLVARQNRWFHESLSDVASIFTVRQLAAAGSRAYPSNWAWFARSISNYANNLMHDPSFQWPAGVAFESWFNANEGNLRKNQYQRKKNRLIAIKILPLLEAEPSHWDAVRFLPRTTQGFSNFLTCWRDECPEQHGEFISALARLFGIALAQDSKSSQRATHRSKAAGAFRAIVRRLLFRPRSRTDRSLSGTTTLGCTIPEYLSLERTRCQPNVQILSDNCAELKNLPPRGDVELIRRRLAEDPTDPQRHLDLGSVLLAGGEYSKAIRALYGATNNRRTRLRALKLLVEAYEATGRPDRAALMRESLSRQQKK